MTAAGESLRARTRRAVRSEVVEVAMALFLSRGFAETTVEDIATAAGISRRSYFRYFASKEDALAEGLAAVGGEIASALEHRPQTESPWLALRRAFDPVLRQVEAEPRAEALGALMLQHPGLMRAKNATWTQTIGRTLSSRLSGPDAGGTIEADALLASALACLHVAQEHWLRPDEPASLSTLLDRSMSSVRAFD
jgi:AcrR family transcriptional regulator